MVVEQGIYYDGYLYRNLVFIRDKLIRKDFDFLCLIDGYSGTGKSTLSMQLAYLCDPTFDLNRMCFRGEEFIKAVTTAQRYQAIVLDEAFASLASTDATTKLSKFLIKMLGEIRQKNLMIFFNMPSFFEMNKNIAVFRSKLLLHVHLGKKQERGYYKIYTDRWKKRAYILGRREYDYSKGGQPFVGRFTGKLPPTIDEEAYRKKKDEALKYYARTLDEDNEETKPKTTMAARWLLQRNALIRFLANYHCMSSQQLFNWLTKNIKETDFNINVFKKAIQDKAMFDQYPDYKKSKDETG